jgi:acyl-CoA synthetase (AMP-forming)/AMP-acid ligase II
MTEGRTSVPCPLRTAALESADAEAVVGVGRTMSYSELDCRVSAAAGRLEELGVSPGARVGLYLPKNVGYLVLLLALMRAGIVACPVSTRLPAGGVEPLLERAGCTVLISGDEKLLRAVEGSTCWIRKRFSTRMWRTKRPRNRRRYRWTARRR